MAPLNNDKTAVRFSVFNISADDEACLGTRRSAWKSEESMKLRHRLDRPPRRPSREQDFLNLIPEEFFVGELQDCDCDEAQPVQQSRPPMPRSILRASKYNTQFSSSSPIVQQRQPKRCRTMSDNSGDSAEEHPTLLFQKHKDSILDLPRLADGCSSRPKSEGSVSPLSLPSLVFLGEDEEFMPSLRRSSNSSNHDFVEELSAQFLGLDCNC